ncbi:hypothetical protein [Longimicrobium sp.]|uniref:hypothetical protein n=1 Tax=Longimicrobium sp. TaxID=2029185 RepID=UPI002E2FE8F3|nr:hypothetical protein [Longimicrobium sp.]HEX6038674.1 hypothetical protein [Longimicrobium sp.]
MRSGRPASSELPRSATRSSRGSTLYFAASMSHSRCGSASVSGSAAAGSRACGPSLGSRRSSSKAAISVSPVSRGVRCLVTAVHPRWERPPRGSSRRVTRAFAPWPGERSGS